MEKNYYDEKPDYYRKRIDLLKERISLLKEKASDSSSDKLKLNTYNMEILELESELDKLQATEEKEKAITIECQENFSHYYTIFTSIQMVNLKQHSYQIQESYNKILAMIDKEWPQHEKNILFVSLKDLLKKMRKI